MLDVGDVSTKTKVTTSYSSRLDIPRFFAEDLAWRLSRSGTKAHKLATRTKAYIAILQKPLDGITVFLFDVYHV